MIKTNNDYAEGPEGAAQFRDDLTKMGLSANEAQIIYDHLQAIKEEIMDKIEEGVSRAPEHLRPMIKVCVLDNFYGVLGMLKPTMLIMAVHAALLASIGSESKKG